ncbi:MAG TPA: FAD binding domain-containing protein, partial [Planctomycetota bacterium]|nr:FAD binding domain-containing protein [Planctomycetota bacterium]
MITLPRFRLHRPRSLAEALRILAEYRGEARVLAGGTDLLVNLRNRLATPSHVVALGCLRSLRDIRVADDGGLRVGALATVAELARHAAVNRAFPVLARAAASVAGPTIRAMGTVGGNLCLDTRCHWYNQDYFWRKACGFCLKKDGSV